MRKYSLNYLKTYFWKSIGYIASFASLVIVTPHLSTSPAVYGIFTFCISLNIFFQYADLGFLNAAQKYASEFYGKNDLVGEIEVTGFSVFIFLIFFIPVSFILLWLSWQPDIIIKGISSSPDELNIASKLLFILFAFSPVLVCQRIVQVIFSVRIESFQKQRIDIIVSALRIISIFYFFGGGRYMIVGYYLFYNCLSLISLFVIVLIARKRYDYSFRLLLSKVRFSKSAYNLTSRLAYNSFFLALTWILFYELDLVYIGYFIDKYAVAYYALGFTLLTFFRDAYGTFYAPFIVRINHFIGQGDENGLMSLYDTLLRIGVPIVIIPVVSLIPLTGPLILAWVGPEYHQSIVIGQILLISVVFGFITYPTSAFLVGRERLKPLYINALILPIVFLGGVLLTQNFWGIRSYAIFKLLALFINALLFYVIMLRILRVSSMTFFSKYLKPIIIPVIVIVSLGVLLSDMLIPQKGAFYLFVIGGIWMGTVILGFFTYYALNRYFRDMLKDVVTSFTNVATAKLKWK